MTFSPIYPITLPQTTPETINDRLYWQKFNKWNIIKFIELERFPKFRPGKGNFGYRYKYLCRCDCGTERILDISQVKSQISKSCGCLVTPKHTDLRATYKEIKNDAQISLIKIIHYMVAGYYTL